MKAFSGKRRSHAALLVAFVSSLLAGCASQPLAAPQATAPAAAPTNLILFGDHGYDLDYLEADDKNPPLTLEQAIAAEREEWAEDKRPPNEFEASPMVRLPDTGGYVSASGLMPVVHAITEHCRIERCDAGVMLGDNIYPTGPTGGADGVRRPHGCAPARAPRRSRVFGPDGRSLAASGSNVV